MRQEPLAVKTVPRMSYDTPSLRVNRYWHRHPERAFALMLALVKSNPAPLLSDWPRKVSQTKLKWDKNNTKWVELTKPPKTLFREPPQPYRKHNPYRIIGCPMCGLPRYKLGWHTDWDGSGVSERGHWHVACKTAYLLMQSPFEYWRYFKDKQNGLCGLTGEPLGGADDIQIDHFVPLYQVYRDYRNYDIQDIMVFWGPKNLSAVTKAAHKAKNKYEAGERAGRY